MDGPALKQRSTSAENSPLWKRLAWMAALWAASVTVIGAVAFLLRMWLAP